MAIHNLDDTTLRNAKEGVYSDGGNLYLRVRKSGSKAWVFRYKIDGKPREIGVGPYPAKSLKDARRDAANMRAAIANGTDPAHVITPPVIAEKKTFKELAEDHIAAKSVEWRNAKHVWQWTRTLEMFVFPTIGKLTPDKITDDHILRILTPIWTTKTETATRVRQRIEAVMSRAITLKMRDRSEGNPAAWKDHLEHLLPAPKKIQKVEHHPAIAHRDLSALLSQLRTVKSVGSYCLQFISLTAVRSGEARGATWDEFDLLNKIWTIPASRMKMNKSHVVPLSAPAMAILRHMMQVGTDHVFASPTKPRQPVSDINVIHTLHRIRPDVTVHGMRSAFRDWCSEETSFPREVVEMSLAHAIKNKTEEAYFRSDLLEKRRALMDAWAVYLVGAEVSPLKQVV
jgi:integrase